MRLLIAAALVAAIVAGAGAIRAHYVAQGDAQGAQRVQSRWDAQKRVDDAAALERQQQANADLLHRFRNSERISDEEFIRAQRRLVRERSAAAVVDRVRGTIDTLNQRDLSSATGDAGATRLAQEAATARELFGSCTAAHTELGAETDRLRDQVAGLQAFVAKVCPQGGGHE